MTDLLGHTLLKRYQIEALLGRGGMAEVYRAHDSRRGYAVAIKVLREDLAEDDEFSRRFQAEAATLAQLQHANIVRFYSFERQAHIAFIVMDFIDGITLRRRILQAAGPLPMDEAVGILKQVGSALHYAHAEGVLHRDIKPGNVMLTPEGKALLSDFGIARMMDSSTVTMMAPGTPAYMSPEQFIGNAVSPASDIYSLGVMAYEMVAGRRPFLGDSGSSTGQRAALQAEHLNMAPPPPSRFNPAVPRALETAILRALAKKPEDRYASALAFIEALPLSSGAPPFTPVYSAFPDPLKPARIGTGPEQLVSPNGINLAVGETARLKPPTIQNNRNTFQRRSQFAIIGVAFVSIILLIGLGFLRFSIPGMQGIIPDRTAISNLPNKITPTHADSFDKTLTVTFAEVPPSLTPTPTVTPSLTPSVTPTVTPSVTPTITLTATSALPSGKVLIPAGPFLMGSNQFPNERPPHTVTLHAFLIDVYEVTNAAYANCVGAGGCQPPESTSSFTRTSYYNNPQYANFPVVFVSWNDADAYCRWDGGRLPTEAEWEKAARGGLEGKQYPWGDTTPVCTQGTTNGAQFDHCVPKDTVAVGSFSPNGYGLYDMAGNAWEWINDHYTTDYYSSSPASNPTGPASGKTRMLRGGGSFYYIEYLRVASRNDLSPASSYGSIGFRCAANP